MSPIKRVECTWRGIPVPLLDIQNSFSQQHVEHAYPHRDGAFIESAGRNPFKLSLKVPFYNNISRAVGDTWPFGDLFPTHFLKFMAACMDRSPGKLQHPTLGVFTAKASDFSWDETADRRDGCVVSVSFTETIDNELKEGSGFKQAPAAAAKQLVDTLSQLSYPPDSPIAKEDPFTLLNLVDEVTAAIDRGRLEASRALQKIDSVIYRVNRLTAAIEAVDSVLFTQAKAQCDSLKETLQDLKETVNQDLGSTRLYIVPQDTTLGALSARLKNDIVTLINLNPVSAREPIIEAGTGIAYRVFSL